MLDVQFKKLAWLVWEPCIIESLPPGINLTLYVSQFYYIWRDGPEKKTIRESGPEEEQGSATGLLFGSAHYKKARHHAFIDRGSYFLSLAMPAQKMLYTIPFGP